MTNRLKTWAALKLSMRMLSASARMGVILSSIYAEMRRPRKGNPLPLIYDPRPTVGQNFSTYLRRLPSPERSRTFCTTSPVGVLLRVVHIHFARLGLIERPSPRQHPFGMAVHPKQKAIPCTSRSPPTGKRPAPSNRKRYRPPLHFLFPSARSRCNQPFARCCLTLKSEKSWSMLLWSTDAAKAFACTQAAGGLNCLSPTCFLLS